MDDAQIGARMSRGLSSPSRLGNMAATSEDEATHPMSSGLKYALDVMIASIALIGFAPLLVMVAIILLVLQGRPIFIAHRRIGQNGVMFPCLKFRSMVNNGDEVLARHLAENAQARLEWNTTRKLRDDPRITPFGAWLRQSSVDEVPQLFNVLRGQMSLVGPRPIVRSEAELFGHYFNHYIRVRPGLTGLWQISGRSSLAFSARVELDVRYVEQRSLWGDIVIIAKTVPAVLKARGSY